MRLRLTLVFRLRTAGQLLVFLLLTPGHGYAEPDPVGRWLTEDRRGVIEIADCGETLCGRIVGMHRPFDADGTPSRDTTGRPKCGLIILSQSQQTSPGFWRAKILNPDDGKVWNCEFSVAADGTLHLRGYVVVPLLGETQTWTRYQGQISPNCAMG
jgi:uncharacterized protein (DUF2147 family)